MIEISAKRQDKDQEIEETSPRFTAQQLSTRLEIPDAENSEKIGCVCAEVEEREK